MKVTSEQKESERDEKDDSSAGSQSDIETESDSGSDDDLEDTKDDPDDEENRWYPFPATFKKVRTLKNMRKALDNYWKV